MTPASSLPTLNQMVSSVGSEDLKHIFTVRPALAASRWPVSPRKPRPVSRAPLCSRLRRHRPCSQGCSSGRPPHPALAPALSQSSACWEGRRGFRDRALPAQAVFPPLRLSGLTDPFRFSDVPCSLSWPSHFLRPARALSSLFALVAAVCTWSPDRCRCQRLSPLLTASVALRAWERCKHLKLTCGSPTGS